MNSKRRLSQQLASSANKLRLDSVNKILKIDHAKSRKQKRDAISKQVSRVALSELLKNSTPTSCHDLPDFNTFLSDEDNVQIFREFLKSQYCHENLEFYLACKRYQSLDPKRVGLEMVKFMANQIYNDFLSKEARSPVNIDYSCIQTVKANLKDPKPDLLLEAQKEILNLMKTDCYPRFCKTWQIDKETARKILSEKPNQVAATPSSIKTVSDSSTSFSSSIISATQNSSRRHSTTRARSGRSHLTLESNKECPEGCPYGQVGLPCQAHTKRDPPCYVPRRKISFKDPSDLSDHLDLRRFHHVPDTRNVTSTWSAPPPLPPKPDDRTTNEVINKKYCPYVGKVFHV